MIDIQFYMKVHELKQRLMNGDPFDRGFIYDELEKHRSVDPVIYNFETTNACNMTCSFCPRTNLMTRSIVRLDNPTFDSIANQITPFSKANWETWQTFVEENYGISRNGASENHFFLHVIPKVIVLHGYGDPLLDRDLGTRVKTLDSKGFPTYFSCNPSNINIDRTLEMFENGLEYIKFSLDSVDDFLHKQLRGNASNFTGAYDRIVTLLEEKRKHNYKTTIVITMIDLGRPGQQEDWKKLQDAFDGQDVYIYLKSQDNIWLQDNSQGTNSLHWTEFCQYPWSSMTIKSNGEVAMCAEDFNNDIILGDATKESLFDIWNGDKYAAFRRSHVNGTDCDRCTNQCDMKVVGDKLALTGIPLLAV